MFGLFKKKTVPLKELLDGFYDVHSHLLWGVDDGCRTAEESIEVAGLLAGMGVKGAYLTPHIIYGVHDSRSEADMRAQYAQMPDLGDFQVRLAAEYHLDEKFQSHIEGPEPPLTLAEDWLLVEYSLGATRASHQNELFEVALSGKNIIVAHPERSAHFAASPFAAASVVHRFGGLLQLDLGSLVGVYGTTAERTARALLKGGHYDLAASDLHRPSDCRWLAHALDELDALVGPATACRLIDFTPRRIVRGDPPV